MSIDSKSPRENVSFLGQSDRIGVCDLNIFYRGIPPTFLVGKIFNNLSLLCSLWSGLRDKRYLLWVSTLVVELRVPELVIITVPPWVYFEPFRRFIIFLFIVKSPNELLVMIVNFESHHVYGPHPVLYPRSLDVISLHDPLSLRVQHMPRSLVLSLRFEWSRVRFPGFHFWTRNARGSIL